MAKPANVDTAEQAAKGAPSREQVNVTGASSEPNSNTASVWFEGSAGVATKSVSGSTVSISQVNDAGLASTFPAGSTARTRKVCVPSGTLFKVVGDGHAAKAAPSREHSNVAAGSGLEKVKVATELVDAAGGAASMVVSGAVRSTTHAATAGEASTLPARSVART